MMRRWLAHPLTRGLDIDDLRLTELRRAIVREKKFLRQIYHEWYSMIVAALPDRDTPVLELGSGGGFLAEKIPGLITSEVLPNQHVRTILSGEELPFANASLRAVVMIDVLHHLPHPRNVFADAARCVQPNGRLIMIEPWVTRWSRLVYTKLHHEPFMPDATCWEFESTGPLSGANGAMAWMIFERDRTQFEREFPTWQIQTVKPFMPFRYLVSGGVSMRDLMPGWSFAGWRWIEQCLNPWMSNWAMFAFVVLNRSDYVDSTS